MQYSTIGSGMVVVSIQLFENSGELQFKAQRLCQSIQHRRSALLSVDSSALLFAHLPITPIHNNVESSPSLKVVPLKLRSSTSSLSLLWLMTSPGANYREPML